MQTVKTYNAAVNVKDTAWKYDPITNTWKLNIILPDSQVVEAKNGFYMVQKETTTIINGVATINVINDTYYFADDGSMLANALTPDGFIVGADGKWIQ